MVAKIHAHSQITSRLPLAGEYEITQEEELWL
jgi:hypothetical protein